MRQFSYRTGADSNDEYCRILETISNEGLHEFCSIVVNNISEEHLNRCPTEKEKKRCLDTIEKRGFKGCIDSWDCKYFAQKNCPQRQAGSCEGCKSNKTAIAQTMIYLFSCIQKVHADKPGLLNCIDTLYRSNMIESILTSSFSLPALEYEINDIRHGKMHFLVNRMYPKLSFLLKVF